MAVNTIWPLGAVCMVLTALFELQVARSSLFDAPVFKTDYAAYNIRVLPGLHYTANMLTYFT